MRHTSLTAALGATTLSLVLVGCGTDSDDTTSASDSTAASSADATTDQTTAEAPDEADVLWMTNPWVKSAKSGMTAAFGTLENRGETDITVTSATSEITSTMELHETVENEDGSMAMQPKEDGFTIPAGGEHELAPGGDHLMIMDLDRALKPGEVITMTLTMEDGSKAEIETTVKTFTGADEKYQNGEMDMGDSGSGMDMGSDEDSADGS